MTGYHDGRRVEWAVCHDLEENGYDIVRASSSKGCADVVGFKTGQVVLVNVKRTTPPGPDERAALLRVAACLPGVAVPLVALKPLRQPLMYRRLTGAGAKEWQPWTPDELA